MAVDDKDYIKGWTVQQGAEPVKPEEIAGTVVTPEQLPDKDALAALGVDVDQYFAGLVVAVDEHEKAVLRGEDPKGDLPGEVFTDEEPGEKTPVDAPADAPAA